MNTSQYGRCLVPESLAREEPDFLKPHIIFNKRIIVPTGTEGRGHFYVNTQKFGFPKDVDFFNLFDVHEFDNYEYDNVNLRTWRYFMFSDSYLRSVLRDRIKARGGDWTSTVKCAYQEGFISQELTEADAVEFSASKLQEIVVGHAMARAKGASFAGDPLQTRLQSLDVFEPLPKPLSAACDYASSYRPEVYLSAEIQQVISAIELVFRESRHGRLMSLDASALASVLSRETPSLRRLPFDSVVRLHELVYRTDRINSVYDWFLRYVENKGIDFGTCSHDNIASLLQDAVWELTAKVEPNPPLEMAKVVVSNVPVFPVNPIGLIMDSIEVIGGVKLRSDYRGLFIFAGLSKGVP